MLFRSKIFGQPGRDTACECERGHEPKLTQALQLINGPMITAKLEAPLSRLSRKLAAKEETAKPPVAGVEASEISRELIVDFYFAALSRPPSEEELKESLAYVAQSENPRQGVEDVCWALVNSKEFLFQH